MDDDISNSVYRDPLAHWFVTEAYRIADTGELRIVETHSLRDTAVNLLDAYVGRAAGQRILAGEVKRGDGHTIEAVIWYSDLRGFTRTSDMLPRNAVIELLNDYFGASKRLDFTVIGPAVNYASRLEKRCAEFGRPLIVSAALAGLLPSHAVYAIGRFALKDIDALQEVYGMRGISA